MIKNLTGTNVVPSHLSLEEYWEFLQINECAGYGLQHFPTTGPEGLGCGDFWNQDSRYFLAHALRKAEERLQADRFLGFPLRRTYYSARQIAYTPTLTLGKHLRSVGVQTWAVVEAAQALTLSNGTINDPVSFTVPVTFTDIDELVLVRPGTTYTTIRPSSVTIAGGVATVTVPRCRLLKADYFQNYKNDNERPSYETDANFLDEISVYRNYVDTTTGANFVWWRCPGASPYYNNNNLGGVWASDCGDISVCSDVRQLTCAYITNQRMGTVTQESGTYADSTWTKSAWAICRRPDGVEINYMRGYYDRYQEMESSITRAVIAIAHNNLPRDYCHCDQQTLYYEDDTRPLEPPVRLALGRSTWGLYEAEQIIREFDSKDYVGYSGGLF